MDSDTKLLWKQSLLSGILIGTGDIINITSGNKYIGAMLFSFALLTIIHNALPLYTGKIGFIREYKFSVLIQMLLFNFIGAVIPVILMLVAKPDLQSVMENVSDTKFSNGFLGLFLLGILCGVMMLIAVYSKKDVITVFCIMIFILSGFEHCIADFPFLMLNLSGVNAVKLLCIVLGNSVGSIVSYELMRKEQKIDT